MIFLKLYLEFFKVGLFAIGGGLATLPFLYDIAEKTGWFTAAQVVDMVAISEATPGPLGIKMAAYAGYTTCGIPGAILAVLGEITPAIIIILVVAGFLNAYKENKYVQSVLYGLQAASTGLIAAAGLSIVTVDILNMNELFAGNLLGFVTWENLILAVALFVAMKKFKKIHPVVYIALSAGIGIAVGAVR